MTTSVRSKRSKRSKQSKSAKDRPGMWGLAAFGFAILASPFMVWFHIGGVQAWGVLAAVVLLALGGVCATVAAILGARNDGVSAWRVVGRTLWAPIRFLLDFTF